MDSSMKSIDDIAMAAVNAYFQINASKISVMGCEDVAKLYTHAYLDSRKVVKRVMDEQKLNTFQNRIEKANEGHSNMNMSNLNLPDDDLGKRFK